MLGLQSMFESARMQGWSSKVSVTGASVPGDFSKRALLGFIPKSHVCGLGDAFPSTCNPLSPSTPISLDVPDGCVVSSTGESSLDSAND